MEQLDIGLVEETVKELNDLMWIDGKKSKGKEEKEVREMLDGKENDVLLETGQGKKKLEKQGW